MSVLYMVFVYFDLLNSNPGFTLALRPLIFVKMVENREQSRKNTENRENLHLIDNFIPIHFFVSISCMIYVNFRRLK